MDITLNGKPVKTVGELAVGESGYVIRRKGVPHDHVRPANELYAEMLPHMSDCYRVTRTAEDVLDMEFVPAITANERRLETVVNMWGAEQFERAVRELQNDGWRIVFGSFVATPEGGGGFNYFIILERYDEN